MESFTIRTIITKKEYLRLTLRETYKSFWPWLLSVWGILFLLLAFAEILGLVHLTRFNIISNISFGLLLILIPFSSLFRANKIYNSSNKIKNETIYTFSQQNIIVEGETFQFKTDWSNIIKYSESKGICLLYEGKYSAHIIPRKYLTELQIIFIKSKINSR